MIKILSLNEGNYLYELQKERLKRAQDNIDCGCLLVYCFRAEKHLLRGLIKLHLENWVFRWSMKRIGIDIKKYKLIIINELNRNPLLFISYIRQQNPDCQIVYQYWNSLFYIKNATPKRQQEFECFIKNRKRYQFNITSFDIKDCQKYNFIYNPQFIPGLNYSESDVQDRIAVDVFFIGKDKDRLDRVLAIKNNWMFYR